MSGTAHDTTNVNTERQGGADGPRRDYRPEGVARSSSSLAALKRSFKEYSEDNMSDWAAALTYYGLLAVFPALIALVAIVGLVGNPASTTHQLVEIVGKLGPSSAKQTFEGPIKAITQQRSAAGVLLIVGTVAALYSASSYVGAFSRASNVIFETPEGRPIWKLKPQQLLVTLVILLLLVVIALSLVLTGPVVTAVASPLGISSSAVSVWDIAKWPVLVLFMILMFSLLYYSSPNVKMRRFRSVAPGAAFALVVWLVASAAFASYVANFGSYNKTYGTLGGAVVFLVWMWLTNAALLLGAQLNSERERAAEIAEGRPRAERELQMEPREEPRTPQTT
ncbi:MAG TPA: YihY/virulence factor BrkB family protein [Solirubrobacteraceae bacterium]|jgi:membrane protein|nr:YihY/virulence factor BrkB family protein [Solirubrobacteraceae bacterium]